jgi:hypothetical protein
MFEDKMEAYMNKDTPLHLLDTPLLGKLLALPYMNKDTPLHLLDTPL